MLGGTDEFARFDPIAKPVLLNPVVDDKMDALVGVVVGPVVAVVVVILWFTVNMVRCGGGERYLRDWLMGACDALRVVTDGEVPGDELVSLGELLMVIQRWFVLGHGCCTGSDSLFADWKKVPELVCWWWLSCVVSDDRFWAR